jgi:hypothetical protein
MTVPLIIQNWNEYALLQSEIHWEWVLMYGNKLETRPQYTPTDCFETFPFPESTTSLEQIGETYYNHRQNIMQTRQEGLTKTYNRFHNPKETDEDIVKLRELHVEMDYAVAAAYGWDDLIPPAPLSKGDSGGLNHDFHETKQGLRYTISETARREVLDRLLQLNHQRYQEEVEQGLHDKKKKAKSGSKKRSKTETSAIQQSLF